ANGTNRVGVVMQTFVAAARFKREAFLIPRDVLPVLLPMAAGSIGGALLINQLSDDLFEKFFGVVMVLLWLG
ncbi:MAG: TSUP family transporter, partial [Gammaproteobacteria bacterium]|nr:TSUP family transporter [Gammaproteobacteria bacterium]